MSKTNQQIAIVPDAIGETVQCIRRNDNQTVRHIVKGKPVVPVWMTLGDAKTAIGELRQWVDAVEPRAKPVLPSIDVEVPMPRVKKPKRVDRNTNE